MLRRRAVNEAVQAAAAAVAAEPGDAENQLVLAGALAAGGDETHRALAHADTALSLDPAYAEAYATRAQFGCAATAPSRLSQTPNRRFA